MLFFYLEIAQDFPVFHILENICTCNAYYIHNQYHIYNIVFVFCLKRKCDSFDRDVCSKSEMYTTACKVDCMTKLYIGKGLVLAIVSGDHVFKIATMKCKLDSLTWIILQLLILCSAPAICICTLSAGFPL